MILQAALVGDCFSVMHDIVSWMTAKKKTFGPSGPEAQKHEVPTPMEISAKGKGFGKGGKDFGKYQGYNKGKGFGTRSPARTAVRASTARMATGTRATARACRSTWDTAVAAGGGATRRPCA